MRISPGWRRLGASLLTLWLLLSPTGLVGAAIHPGCRTDNGGNCRYTDETFRLPGTITAMLANMGNSAWATGSLANMVASQGIASLASSAAGQFVSNGEVNWNTALAAGLTAGISAGLTNVPLFDGKSLNQLANVQTVAGNVVSASFDAERFASSLLGIAGRGVVAAGVGSAIAGSSFGAALQQSIANDLAAVGANAIGGQWAPQTAENVLAHAGLGCAAAAAGGRDCASGALGGAGAAIINPLIDPLTSSTDATARAIEHQAATMLISGTLADKLGLDPLAAATAAQNETVNNYLSPKQIKQKKEELAGAETDEKRQEIAASYAELDAQQRDAAAACLLGNNCASVMDPLAVKAVLVELQAACAAPLACSPEAIASIAELNGLYGRTDALISAGPVEEVMAWIYGGKLVGTGLSALWGRIVGGTVEIGGVGGTAASGGVKGGEPLLWGSWRDYPKVTAEGRTYAQVGDRLYTEHAVNRMQLSGLGAPAGELSAGRNVSPNIVEEVIRAGQPTHAVVDGVSRTVYWSGNVGVVTENGGKLVVAILRRGSP